MLCRNLNITASEKDLRANFAVGLLSCLDASNQRNGIADVRCTGCCSNSARTSTNEGT